MPPQSRTAATVASTVTKSTPRGSDDRRSIDWTPVERDEAPSTVDDAGSTFPQTSDSNGGARANKAAAAVGALSAPRVRQDGRSESECRSRLECFVYGGAAPRARGGEARATPRPCAANTPCDGDEKPRDGETWHYDDTPSGRATIDAWQSGETMRGEGDASERGTIDTWHVRRLERRNVSKDDIGRAFETPCSDDAKQRSGGSWRGGGETWRGTNNTPIHAWRGAEATRGRDDARACRRERRE